MEKMYILNDLTREKNDYDFYKGFKNGELVDAASDIKYANLFDKIKYVINPGIVGSEKDVARKVLEERGVDWKTRQVTRYSTIKRANKIYWNNVKNELIAPWRAMQKFLYHIKDAFL